MTAPDAGLLGDPVQLGGRQVGLALGDGAPGGVDGLVDQVHQPHRAAGPGLERPPVRPEHGAERDVHRLDALGQPAHPPRRLEDQAEVQRLPGVDDVEDAVGLQVADAVAQRREVRGVVAVAAVALLHHQHGRLAVGGLDLLGLDDDRAVAVLRDARGEQLLDHLGQPLVVDRLARGVARLQQHAEPAVDLPERDLGLVDDLAPARERRLVAGLQGDDPGPRPVGERLVGVELGARHAVQPVERGDRRRTGFDLAGFEVGVAPPRLGVLVEVLDQHPELGAPVAEVVLPDHGGAEVAEHPREAVADDRRAQVADVHLLGDVGRRVVDRPPAQPCSGRSTPEPVVGEAAVELAPEALVRDRDVEEAGPGDLDLGDPVDVAAAPPPAARPARRGAPSGAWRRRGRRWTGSRRGPSGAPAGPRRRARVGPGSAPSTPPSRPAGPVR